MKKVLLDVEKLETNYYKNNEALFLLYDISFKLYREEIVVFICNQNIFRRGLIYSIMRTIDKPLGRIVNGEISFKGKDILNINEKEMRSLRGRKISAIHNAKVGGLNPRLKIGYQVKEPLIIHNKAGKEEAEKEAKKTLGIVGIKNVNEVYESYPHQLDEAIVAKIHLAIGLICKPEILIINNITEELNEAEKIEILDLLKALKSELGLSILFMTDDLAVVEEIADRVIVADKGILLEDSPIERFNHEPLHPYVKELVKGNIEKEKEWDLKSKAHSCIYYDQCDSRRDLCLKYLPEYLILKDGQKVRCVLYR